MKASFRCLAPFVACVLLPVMGTSQMRLNSSSGSSAALVSSSIDDAQPIREVVAESGGSTRTSTARSPIHWLGFDLHLGLNGAGADIALPVARRFNVRAGGEYLRYTGHFTEQGAEIDADLRLGNGKVALDWFPFNNGFRVSPMVVFAIQTEVNATALIPGGSTVELDGSSYISSPADPLHGQGSVKTRKAAPGLSVGWGNISPRGNRHLSFPVELGFYYIGQPDLQVSFSGTACDPSVSAAVGCQDVTQDASFQRDLNAFIQRNQHNLSYASFFPIASFGVGYRF